MAKLPKVPKNEVGYGVQFITIDSDLLKTKKINLEQKLVYAYLCDAYPYKDPDVKIYDELGITEEKFIKILESLNELGCFKDGEEYVG